MIYIMGDLHGEFERLSFEDMSPGDYLIICGDFGMVWYGNVREQSNLETFSREAGDITILFVDGNHENFPLIYDYPVKEWHGGLVHEIMPNILHLMRGQIFNIEGKTFFSMGGATSIDKEWRTPGHSWWPEEIPSHEEMQNAMERLEAAEWKVDYVLTHCAPEEIRKEIFKGTQAFKGTDPVTEFLQVIDSRLEYQKWYLGHYHIEEQIDDKHQVLYETIIQLEEE